MSEFTTASQEAYKKLREKILSGELKPGERLVHRKLCKELGVNNVAVIGSLAKLERDTLVEYTPGLGARVRIWSLKDVIELLLIRETVETTAIRLYTQTSTPQQRQMLMEFGNQFKNAVMAEDNKAIMEADIAIHTHIVKCTDMPMLYRFVDNSSLIDETVSKINRGGIWDYPRLLDSHDALIEAANGEDPDIAERAVRATIGRGIERLLRNNLPDHERCDLAFLNKICKLKNIEPIHISNIAENKEVMPVVS